MAAATAMRPAAKVALSVANGMKRAMKNRTNKGATNRLTTLHNHFEKVTLYAGNKKTQYNHNGHRKNRRAV